jgi:uncharacterized protein involved in exopolysaccharide biosynthesis
MHKADLPPLEPSVFREYFGVVRKRMWLIVLLAFALVMAATVGSFLARPVYQTRALILIEAKNPIASASSSLTTLRLPAFSKAEIMQTQTRIIQSRPLLEEVVLTLELDKRTPPDDFTQALKTILKDILGQVNRFIVVDLLGGTWTPIPSDRSVSAVEELKRNVTVAPVAQTDLLEIVVNYNDPVMAERIANTLAQIYTDRNASLDSFRADTSYRLLSQQLALVEPQLEASEEALKAFKMQHGILSIQTKATDLTKELATLEADYNQTVLQRKETEEKLKQTKTWLLSFSDREESVTTTSDISNDTLNTELKSKLLSLESQLAGLVAYQAQAPDPQESAKAVAQIAQVSAEINQVNKQLPAQAETEVSTSSGLSTAPNPVYQNLTTQLVQYEVDLAGLQVKEEALLELIEQHRAELTTLAEEELELQRLTRAVSVNTNLYNKLLQDKEQAQADAAIKLPNVRFVEAAKVPTDSTFPNLLLNIAAAFATAIVLGVGLAFWLEYLDDSIRSPQDVGTYLDLPLVGAVPTLKS